MFLWIRYSYSLPVNVMWSSYYMTKLRHVSERSLLLTFIVSFWCWSRHLLPSLVLVPTRNDRHHFWRTRTFLNNLNSVSLPVCWTVAVCRQLVASWADTASRCHKQTADIALTTSTRMQGQWRTVVLWKVGKVDFLVGHFLKKSSCLPFSNVCTKITLISTFVFKIFIGA